MAVTIQDVLDKLMDPVAQIENTVDTLKFGDSTMEVTGIVTTFMATHQVIQQAIAMGANLLITHEGTFYSHHDSSVSWENDPVVLEKQKLIKESGIAIYRFHDYWHRYQPDGIMVGLLQDLEWQQYVVENQPAATILEIPTRKLSNIAEYIKVKLGIKHVRLAGKLSADCTRIGLLAGYRGGGSLCIPLYEQRKLDLIIAGEGPEWETPEYVRDALYQGNQRNLIVIGHAESEQSGMRYLAEYLRPIFPDTSINFLPVKPSLQVV